MNHTEYPALNNAVDGFVFQKHEANATTQVDQKALEVSCVNLLSKLENLFAKAMEMQKVDFVDESATIARNMLTSLMEFSNEFLAGNAAEQAKEEINRATTHSYAYDEVLKTRPISNAVLRTFWTVAESDEIQLAHSQLSEALVRGCAATFYHAVLFIGIDTAVGKQIDQSSVVFVTELKQSWNHTNG